MEPRLGIENRFFFGFFTFLRMIHREDFYLMFEGIPFSKFLTKSFREIKSARQEFHTHPFSYIYTFIYFSFLWIYFSKKRKEMNTLLNEKKGILEHIITTIPNFTDILWKEKQITVSLGVHTWGEQYMNFICIGIAPTELFSQYLGVCIHECIHLNASSYTEQKIHQHTHTLSLADELATILLTRKIQKEICKDDSSVFLKPSVELTEIGIEESELETIEIDYSFPKLVSRCYTYISEK